MKRLIFIFALFLLFANSEGQIIRAQPFARAQVVVEEGFDYPVVLDDGNTMGWYIADEVGTLTKDAGTGEVSKWEDYLESGRDLIQAGATKYPIWSATGILFDGSNDILETATFDLNQPEFVYIVLKQVAWTNNRVIFDGYAGESGGMVQNYETPMIHMNACGFTSTQLTIGNFGILRALFNGASSKIIVDANVPATGTYGVTNMDGFTLGGSGYGADYTNIEVKEVIIRKVADSSGDEGDIYDYLKAKYGL